MDGADEPKAAVVYCQMMVMVKAEMVIETDHGIEDFFVLSVRASYGSWMTFGWIAFIARRCLCGFSCCRNENGDGDGDGDGDRAMFAKIIMNTPVGSAVMVK